MLRKAESVRNTKETNVRVSINMDGEGNSTIDTGVGFLDHMLTLLAAHGRFDLEVSCKGDLQVDVHHTVEDVGIVLGKAMAEALGQRTSIRRYGSCIIPMDEALALVSMDMGMRAFLAYDVPFSTDRVGEMDTEMFEEFFRALSQQAGITLHIKLMYGKNNHHIAEAVFKAFARALREATSIDETIKGVLSSKGVF